MTGVKIVSDSTFDLPVPLVEEYNIGILPANIIFDEEVKQQYVDITTEEFYRRLIEEDVVPTTGVPPPRRFKTVYDQALEESDEVVVFCLSSKLSGMFATATMVANRFFDERITVVDSRCTTLQMGLIVLEAAKKAKEGLSKPELLEYISEFLIPNAQAMAGAGTLKYLQRSGRVSRIASLVGEVLHLKPLLRFEDGEIISPGKVRGSEGLFELLQKFAQHITRRKKTETAFVVHSRNREKAEELLSYFRKLTNAPQEIFIGEIGSVVGTHIGPGLLGITWIGDYQEDWF
ncbi:MAG: DegV family EDD domain-containing protein [Candidatus Heimdallarchaeota archaeon]|nr:DegV family EDD domain-containing protein [Candidatus Heimdallarchaeota archaeon]